MDTDPLRSGPCSSSAAPNPTVTNDTPVKSAKLVDESYDGCNDEDPSKESFNCWSHFRAKRTCRLGFETHCSELSTARAGNKCETNTGGRRKMLSGRSTLLSLWMCSVLSFILLKTSLSWWTRLKSGKTRKLQLDVILLGRSVFCTDVARHRVNGWIFRRIMEEHARLVRSKSAPKLFAVLVNKWWLSYTWTICTLLDLWTCCEKQRKRSNSKHVERSASLLVWKTVQLTRHLMLPTTRTMTERLHHSIAALWERHQHGTRKK